MATQEKPTIPYQDVHTGKKPTKTLWRSINEFRARIIRFLAVPTPGLRNSIPILGGRTVIEILLFCAAFVITIYFAATSSAINAANISGLVCILLALRYNVLLLLFNLSFERALFWHKVLALVFIAVTSVHISSVGANSSGLTIIITMVLMSFIYVVKNYHFETFYYTHLACLISCCVAAYMHGADLVALGGGIWLADFILRYGLLSKRITGKAFILPGNVVRIEFPHSFSYEAGQYCFLRIYEINPFEFHPFSLSSSPHEETSTFHIRALGNWSHKLLNYLKTKVESMPNYNPSDGVPIEFLCEGPFGMTMVDWENDKDYQVFLLVSGGVGITPLQSIFSELIHSNQHEGRSVRKAIFVWSVKDLELVRAFGDTEKGKYTHAINHIGDTRHKIISMNGLPGSFQPMTMDVPEIIYDSESGSGKELTEIDLKREPSLSDILYTVASNLVFLPRFHLTSLKTKELVRSANDDPSLNYILKPGRPDLPVIFRELGELCEKEKFSRVAVLVCGPHTMVSEVDDLCRASKLACSGVRFDCHKEVFDF